MLSEPAQSYLSQLPVEKQAAYQGFTVSEKSDFNRFSETLSIDIAKSYSKELQKGSISPDTTLSAYKEAVLIAMQEAKQKMDYLFSKEQAVNRQLNKEATEKDMDLDAEAKDRGLTLKDIKTVKELEKMTGNPILEKYATKQNLETAKQIKQRSKVLKKYGRPYVKGDDENKGFELEK